MEMTTTTSRTTTRDTPRFDRREFSLSAAALVMAVEYFMRNASSELREIADSFHRCQILHASKMWSDVMIAAGRHISQINN
jgi:hypothetical protein